MKTTTSRPLTLVHDSNEAKLAPLKVLVIDDQSTGRIVLGEIMRSLDASLEVATFADPVEAIEYARKHAVDMVLTDYKMPNLDGIETIRRLRRIFGYEDVPIVCITVVNDREVRYRALEAGATDFLIRPIDRLECGARCRNLLSLRRHEILKKNRTRILEQKIDEATRELRRREVDTLFRLAKAAEQRDKVTGMHLVRMAKYSSLIARSVGLSSAEQDAIELAAPMHDIGKIGIPDRILQNPGKLDGEGGYTVVGRLMPAEDSLRLGALPLGLAHQVKLLNPVGAGEPVLWSNVACDESSEAVRLRREMEAAFAAPKQRAA